MVFKGLRYLTAVALVLGAVGFPSANEAINNEKGLVRIVSVSEKQASQQKKAAHDAITQVLIRDFLQDYLGKVTPLSKTFRKMRDKHGENGVLNNYVDAHKLCLDLAEKYMFREIPEYEVKKLGRRLSVQNAASSKGISKAKYLDKDVERCFGKWGELKAKHFKLLLETTGKVDTSNLGFNALSQQGSEEYENYIRELHHNAYAKETYDGYIQSQNKASEELYDAIENTLDGLEKLFGGSSEIMRIDVCTKQVYTDTIERFFPEEKTE